MERSRAPKIFIVGLPRTGTTSICAALLEQGYRVAHTAFSQAAFYHAEVIADAPVFSDYPNLDLEFPNSKFIYLDRNPKEWVASAKKLLSRIRERHALKPTAFSPVLIRSYISVFGEDCITKDISSEQLVACFNQHKQGVMNYFSSKSNRLVMVSLDQAVCEKELSIFCGVNLKIPHLNNNGKISDWNRLKSDKKVDPNLLGENGRKYFSFENA